MASLTHVCMWTDNGWVPITAEKAAEIHPGGTVSAHSGLFMCELCGQYVTLTDGPIQTRHFRHSASEKSKNCPERLFRSNHPISYKSQEHELPIRITDVSSSSFRFEVGLIRAPIDSLDNDFRLKIIPKDLLTTAYVFSKERLNNDRITYLPVGDRPHKKYFLEFQNGNNKLHEFWPAEINGIDPEGTLFDKYSGRKLTIDADVEIKKEYYLLKRGYFNKNRYKNIQIQEITRKQFDHSIWTLFVVSASRFCEEAARFFLDFHCRLTDLPVSLQPIWPLFVSGSYILKHNQDKTYFLVKGNISAVNTFPSSKVCQLTHNNPHQKLYEITCSNRQQLISAGRAQALQYTYFWKEPLTQVAQHPKIVVTDLSDTPIISGETNIIPNKKTLLIKSPFDGELIIFKNKHVKEKRKLFADKHLEYNELEYGLTIQVKIGLDIIWQIKFKPKQSTTKNNEDIILKQINSVSGVSIPAPHSLRNMLVELNQYPKICQWIRKCIKLGNINEQSYRILQFHCRSIKLKHGE